MLSLSELYRYPLKSGRGEALQRSAVDGLGLHGDRRWMVVEAESGRFITQRLLPQMSQLGALYDARGGLTLSAPGRAELSVALRVGHELGLHDQRETAERIGPHHAAMEAVDAR